MPLLNYKIIVPKSLNSENSKAKNSKVTNSFLLKDKTENALTCSSLVMSLSTVSSMIPRTISHNLVNSMECVRDSNSMFDLLLIASCKNCSDNEYRKICPNNFYKTSMRRKSEIRKALSQSSIVKKEENNRNQLEKNLQKENDERMFGVSLMKLMTKTH